MTLTDGDAQPRAGGSPSAIGSAGTRALGPGSPRRPRRRRWLVLLLAVLCLSVASYVRALTYPGHASVVVRTVEWVRDHNGSVIIDTLENRRYSRRSPPTTGTPPRSALPAAVLAVPPAAAEHPSKVTVVAGAPLPGEGQWQPVGARSSPPPLYTTFFRPDPQHPTVLVGAALFPQQRSQLHLNPGTRQPVAGTTDVDRAQVPAADRPGLVATFNGGFKTADARGGWYADGRALVPLDDGAASVVIRRDGSAVVGQWGRDVSMSPQVAAVRQNLALIVEGGQPVDGLTSNAHGRWGSPKNQYQYTWRSGLGQTPAGDLVYVAGDKLTLVALAQALAQAGATRAMQLDIHTSMVSFNAFGGSTGSPSTLLPSMTQSARRDLAPDQRDFFYVTTPASLR